MYNIAWTNGAPMLQGEPPGPLLMIYEVQDLDEAVSLHNQCDFRRMTGLFTSPDNPRLNEAYNRLQTGAIYLNQAPTETMDPLGFYGHANNGSTYGTDLIRAITRRKFLYNPS